MISPRDLLLRWRILALDAVHSGDKSPELSNWWLLMDSPFENNTKDHLIASHRTGDVYPLSEKGLFIPLGSPVSGWKAQSPCSSTHKLPLNRGRDSPGQGEESKQTPGHKGSTPWTKLTLAGHSRPACLGPTSTHFPLGKGEHPLPAHQQFREISLQYSHTCSISLLPALQNNLHAQNIL